MTSMPTRAAGRTIAGERSGSPSPTLAAPVRLHHRVLLAGAPDRPPLVLLHGFSGDGRSWSGLVRAWRMLARAAAGGSPAGGGHRHGPALIALDLPGHGRSPQPPRPEERGMVGTVRAVEATLDALGLARVHLLGYSMGGRVALSLALRAPGRLVSLSLIGASPGIADAAERAARAAADEAWAGRIAAEGLPAFVDAWLAQPLFASQARLPAALRRAERSRRLTQSPTGLAESLRAMGTGRMPPLWEALPGLAVPCLYLAGALDAKFLALGRRMAQLTPRLSVHAIPDAGHAAQLEAPEAVARLLWTFVEGAEAKRP